MSEKNGGAGSGGHAETGVGVAVARYIAEPQVAAVGLERYPKVLVAGVRALDGGAGSAGHAETGVAVAGVRRSVEPQVAAVGLERYRHTAPRVLHGGGAGSGGHADTRG